MIRLSQLKLPIRHDELAMMNMISKKLKIKSERIMSYKIHKKSLDARKKPDLYFVYVIDVKVENEKEILKTNSKLEKAVKKHYKMPEEIIQKESPLIVGFGPAGIFAAYILAKAGLKPIVFERGEDVDSRTITVESFWNGGELNEESNVQFGEGGAGTFSDGKLTTRSKDPRAQYVLELLVEHGAPEEILYVNKPHVGTDVLKGVVKSIREEILKLGGTIHFNTKVESLIIEASQIVGLKTTDMTYESNDVILAVGHSARDTYKMIFEMGVAIEQKPFAMGLRIEHLQKTIDVNQYGSIEAREVLGASDYKLTHKANNGRSVYSFCVCPGGMVVASASELGGIVVNGMSEQARNQDNINSALLVQINTEDFGSDHPLAGIEFQRKYEQLAFELTDNNLAPIQTVGSFLRNEDNIIDTITPSYRPGTNFKDLSLCLPDYVIDSLKEGIESFGKKIKGFDASDVILTGIESRSSAPIRMLRNYESLESYKIKGLYPVGEGAGYAGGIVSSAIDGIKVAEIIATK